LLGSGTVYVARNSLTLRLSDSRLIRKTSGCSGVAERNRAVAAWDDMVYNLARPRQALRRRTFDNPRRRW